VTGDPVFDSPKTFENGIGDWYADRGTWEVGVPLSGPGSAYSGENVAGTVLNGNYEENVDSRLISPPFKVPAASENPRLRFWHWYSFSNSDLGFVQIKTGNGNWETISPDYTNTGSGVWTYSSIDLSTKADSTVQVAFYFRSRTGGNYPYNWVSSGWYIDDIGLFVGDDTITPPAPPKDLKATVENNQPTLTWVLNTESDLKLYRIYRNLTSPPATLIDSVPVGINTK